MQEMVIYGVSFDMVGKQPIVLLKTAEGNKFLPIWIGHPEAAAILMKLQGANTPRPMTHDLVTDMLEKLEARVIRIAVTELRENTFYAVVTVAVDGSEIEIDSRPSDAIALAVRSDAPIYRGRLRDRGERHRVRARGRERGRGRRGVQEVPRRGQARRLLRGSLGLSLHELEQGLVERAQAVLGKWPRVRLREPVDESLLLRRGRRSRARSPPCAPSAGGPAPRAC